MKIAVVVGMFPKISETFIVSQITGLIDRGHEVTIIAKEHADKLVQSDVAAYGLEKMTLYPKELSKSKPARILRFAADLVALTLRNPMRALRSLRAAMPFDSPGMQRFYFADLFRGKKFDVIHCHFGFTGQLVAQLDQLGLVDGPILTSFHGVDIGAAATADAYRQLAENGDSFTANSNFSANRAGELGFPMEKIALLPVGLQLDDFPFVSRTKQDGKATRLLTVGRLIESKGIHVALEAMSELPAEVEYDVVGDGPARTELEQLAESLGIAERVRFHGALLREKVLELYRDAHLFVLPSLAMEDQSVGMEGQGLVLQEAQATGLPVIASRCCGIPEGVLDGESGLLCPAGDAAALAGCILTLTEQHDRWPAFGKAGRGLVEDRFDIEKLNDRLVSLYRESATSDSTVLTS